MALSDFISQDTENVYISLTGNTEFDLIRNLCEKLNNDIEIESIKIYSNFSSHPSDVTIPLFREVYVFRFEVNNDSTLL